MLLARGDLPKEVKLQVSFFEKQRNVYQDQNLRKKLTIGGDLINYHKTSQATFD